MGLVAPSRHLGMVEHGKDTTFNEAVDLRVRRPGPVRVEVRRTVGRLFLSYTVVIVLV